jgi:hypothetical protein
MESQTPQAPEMNLAQGTISMLSGHISSCFTNAQQAKTDIIERLLACERQRRGEYDPATKAMILASGGQEIYMMLTDIKCRAADSWIKDVIMNHAESTWALSPSAEPTLPPELQKEVTATMMQEAAMVAAQGIQPDPEVMAMREKEIHDEATAKVQEIAKDRCERMETRITDKLQEGGWDTSLKALIYDFTTYPTVFIKGPVLRKKKVMTWGPGFKPVVQEQVVIEVDRVSPWDIFPSPGAVTIQDGFLIHRHRLSRKAVRQMQGMPGASSQAIRDVLETYRLGLKTTLNGDNEHEQLQGRTINFGADGLIEALEYWGPASGQMLREWGMSTVNGMAIDDLDEYQINAWKIGGYVVRVQINPNPLDQRPYSKASFEDIPGAFWGKALPEMMSDVQIMCNASARALAMNMGIASGPQVEVSVDRLPPGEAITSMFPWKVWQTTSDRSGSGQPAVRFFQPSMNAAELLGIFTHFSKLADEVTGVPNYIYGSSNVSGAGRTASGLSMLMENAAKGIKHAILGLDGATTEVIVRIYNHLMMFDPDQAIKGDMNVVAAGAIGAMIREQQAIARKEFMADTANPFDMQIIGLPGRAYMLRERAKGIFTDVNKIVPDPAKLAALMAQQAEQQAAAAQQQGGAPGGSNIGPGSGAAQGATPPTVAA